jgi:hypothetical protein
MRRAATFFILSQALRCQPSIVRLDRFTRFH